MENQEKGSDLANIDGLEIEALSDEELNAVAGGDEVSPVDGGDGGSTKHASCSCSCCVSGATL